VRECFEYEYLAVIVDRLLDFDDLRYNAGELQLRLCLHTNTKHSRDSHASYL